ncbi:MAG: sigma 54-interacting transcriptional regulator [Deltaproteobacteria bacterium]|nr:sigma 54-interacting transcriptional regulator [Deltaproteobacteria bacterium]
MNTFVGREAEIARLSAAYEDATARGERLVIVRGASGIGKTRLLSELKGRLRLQGAPVLEGHCAEGGRAYAPFGEILSAGLAFLEDVGVRSDLDLSPMLFSLGSRASLPDSSAALTDAERRVRFFDTFRSFLGSIAAVRTPLVILHDVHRADPGTRDLLGHLVDGAGPFIEEVRPAEALRALFVVSMRSDAGGAELHDLRAHPKAQCIELGGLGPKGLRELLESPAVIERIMALTGGRPDDIEALLATPPGRTEDRLRRRIASLGDRARAGLGAMSVVNRPASPAVLARVAGLRAPGAEIAELLASGLATKAVVDGEIQLSFARSSERDSVYADLEPVVVRSMHRAFGEILEAGQPIGVALQDLAFHYLRAGDATLGARYAGEAADALCRAYAQDAAAVLLEKALEIASEEDLPALHERLVTAYRSAGDHARALEHAKKLREWRPDDAASERRMGELYTLAGEYDSARTALESARALAARSHDRRTLAEVEADLAEVAYQKGDYDQAFQSASRALAIAQDDELPPVALHARNTLGKVHLSRGEFGAAAEVFGENVEAAQAAALEVEELRATINLAIAQLRRQELGSAEELFVRASRIADARGTLYYQAICRENLAVLAHDKGEYDRALDLYHDAVALLKKLGNRPLLGRVATNLGWLYLLFGDTQRARSLAELSASMGEPRASVRFHNLVLRGDIELAEGRSDAAREALAAAHELARQTGDQAILHHWALAAGKLALHDGDTAAARRILAQVGKVESPVRAAAFAVLRADVERAAGCDPYPAAARAVELAERARDADVEWRAHLRLSRALVDRGDAHSAERHLRMALQIDARLRERVPESFRSSWDCVQERLELRRQAQGLDLPRGAPPAVLPAVAATPAETRPWGARYPQLVGNSRAMKTVCSVIDKVAPAESLVLIRGESGTGKELVAEAIHSASARRDRPLIKVNCAALVETLLLSELFGHERGAFTGALNRKKGRFELADGGTLFLDEIGDISPTTQVSLLRVLQEREFERVGGTTAVRVDVRILCATNRDLEQMVERGQFREDLYYRLKGLQVELPPLRQRPEDVPVLARHFLGKIAAERGEAPRVLAEDALDLLVRYGWPGNVRELENTLRSVTLFAEGPVLTAAHFAEFAGGLARGAASRSGLNGPAPDRATPGPGGDHGRTTQSPSGDCGASPAPPPPEQAAYGRVIGGDVSLRDLKRDIERECIGRALAQTRGNITKAAALLGMKRPRLSQLIKQYGLSAAEGGR